jgi:peptide/nickel transport system permease protein
MRSDPAAVLGLLVVLSACLAAVLVPFLASGDPSYQGAYVGGDLTLRLAPPSLAHPLGMDSLGRDVLLRLLFGARISLTIGLLSVAISVGGGTLLGSVAGYIGGVTDSLLMRLADVVMAFPRIVLLVVISALFRPSLLLIVGALALTQWPEAARVVRGEVIALRQRGFAEAAVALGFSRPRIILRHLLPHAMGPILVLAALGIGNAIVLEASLSFLGLGVQPPTPSWGTMVADGLGPLVEGAWWPSTFPGLAIALVVLALNLVGDGLRDALDPRRTWRLPR